MSVKIKPPCIQEAADEFAKVLAARRGQFALHMATARQSSIKFRRVLQSLIEARRYANAWISEFCAYYPHPFSVEVSYQETTRSNVEYVRAECNTNTGLAFWTRMLRVEERKRQNVVDNQSDESVQTCNERIAYCNEMIQKALKSPE